MLLAPELFTTDSGIPRMLRLYLKALCDLARPEDEVVAIALNDPASPAPTLAAYSGPALRAVHGCARDKLRFILTTLRETRRADLLICGHLGQLPVAWLARLLAPKLRYLLVAHGIEVWRPYRFWERQALRGAALIACVSDYTRREIARFLPAVTDRLAVLPNALDPVLVAPAVASVAASPDIILSVARLDASDAYKGIDHLIAALPEILRARPNTRLRIVGRGSDLARLQQLARDQSVVHAVDFLGFVSDEQLRDEFSRCALFALPSAKEGFGLVYLEAMTHGKPCIAAAAGGAPEVITPECGLSVPYGDIGQLAAGCLHALGQAWNERAIRAHAETFSYSQFQQRLASLLA